MSLRTILATAAAKAVLAACHLTGRPGSSLPGRAALKVDPQIIASLAAQVRRGIIVTCGTNGKTTTNNLLCDMLEAQGFRVVSNRLGANMMEGVAAALATAASPLATRPPGYRSAPASGGPLGYLDADFACLEVDEASAARVLQYLKPDYMIITGLFRDQLDRYGEIDLTMKALEKAIALAPDMTLVINGDDPLTAFLAQKSGHRFVAFGVSEQTTPEVDFPPAEAVSTPVSTPNSSDEIREGRFCENCGAPLHYDFYHFSQLGVYRCPSCGFKRPAIAYDAARVTMTPQLSFDVLEEDSAPIRISAPMTGFYNVYNILAVYGVLRELDLPTESINEVLRNYKPQFGRGELFYLGRNREQKVLLNLAKNPTGFGQNIAAMLQDRSPKDLIIAINDNAQDGRDISWLWDVDFERLADETVLSITVSGLRALDMQLRLKYAEIASTSAKTVEEAIERRLADGCGNLYVLVNYTALYEAHKYLEGTAK
ncbi:MAG: DUF1727 domain-containing protein [Lachnospiraceae bacterium]|nr:DUF1727 domain-containing protein [Lachnospiraceae bacterium]